MFHFAEPELNGFGVSTCTPGRTRSFQPLMCFGLPLRTAKTTTVSAAMPPYAWWFHFESTRPASTSRLTSVPVERKTGSALRPFATARAWSVEAPYDWLNATPSPSPVFCQAWMIFPSTLFGVEYATRDRFVLLEAALAPVARASARRAPPRRSLTLFIGMVQKSHKPNSSVK